MSVLVPQSQPVPAAPPADAPRLLLVDDSSANRRMLERLFFTHGYRVTTAADGLEALEHLARTTFDVVLMDIMMPRLDGLETLRRIRASDATAELPVVLISAMSNNSDVVVGLNLGANDYLIKPVDVNIAVARVRTQLTLKRLLDERKRTITDLQETQAMRERFFQIASHDLKGPLTNLRVLETLLRGTLQPTPPAIEYLNVLRDTVDTMRQVVEDFLDSAALQTGTIDLHRECVSAEQLILDATAQHQPSAQDKRIALAVGNTVGEMYVDPDRLSQVLSNFLSNAVKYSPAHTVVRVWSEYDGDSVRVCVADQGPGIPEAERDKLFQPFSRTSVRPTGGESSTGLGLWIAQHLVSLHGGSVGVNCPPQGGSVFWLSVPVCA